MTTMRVSVSLGWRWAAVLAAGLVAAGVGQAMQQPDEGEVSRLRDAGRYEQRVQQALRIGNQKAKPWVVERAAVKIERLRLQAEGKSPEEVDRLARPVPPAWRGMPTVGSPKVLIFLVEFPDHPHKFSKDVMQSMVFGSGNPANFPRESLKSFYARSSYGKLQLQGDVLGWYKCKHERAWYCADGADSNNEKNLKLIEEVVDYYDQQGVDFKQYDNNGDGNVDYFAILWTGPRGEWATFWWGYQWSLYSGNLKRDGVRFYDFSWQWEADQPYVLIHETGHALGLPDYYDYDDKVGPRGGVGGLDMMDANWGDHNAFSKWLLDWIEPTVVSAGQKTVTLKPTAKAAEALVVMPGASSSKPFSEFFVVQNRQRGENDAADYPADGVLVWHVDARLDGQGRDFAWNNSDTAHKLLRLMEADGKEQIEQNKNADAGDYYKAGLSFGPSTKPNSKRYDGTDTAVTIDSIVVSGGVVTLRASAGGAGGGGGEAASFAVHNDGQGPLTLTRIGPGAAWLTVTPAAPVTVPVGGSVKLTPAVDWSKVPAGGAEATVAITSDDPNHPTIDVRVKAAR